MEFISGITQLVVATIVVYFISGRLIGSQVSFGKRILSVIMSVTFTTFVFWYTYLRDQSYYNGELVTNVMNVATLLWLGSMLLISMLLYLFFELFDPISLVITTALSVLKDALFHAR